MKLKADCGGFIRWGWQRLRLQKESMTVRTQLTVTSPTKARGRVCPRSPWLIRSTIVRMHRVVHAIVSVTVQCLSLIHI